ncbi:YisL family protein [Liquorilactobacillus oeni]|nr:YisL family protein [Liquorilactobacillus oeni]
MIWIHLSAWLILLILTWFGLKTSQKKAKVCAMGARICYIIAIISGFWLFKYAWQRDAMLTIVKLLIAFGSIGFIEVAFAEKLHGRFSRKLFLLAVGSCCLVGVVGFILAQGRPFI